MPKIIADEKSFVEKTSLFMIDVDDFKKINDTFGHLVGDKMLIDLAKIMKDVVLEKGIAARYAGDEFLILLPGHDEDEAQRIGESILLSASQLKWTAKDRNFTGQGISIGVAFYPGDSAFMTQLINCADQALYAAKKSGKNKIYHYKSVSKEIKDRAALWQTLLKPPLIDFKEEIENLKEHYKLSASGKKQSVLIEGYPGGGKTRVLEEFAKWTDKQDAVFIFCRLEDKKEPSPLTAQAKLLSTVANSLGVDKFGLAISNLTPEELAEIAHLYPAAKGIVKDVPVKSEPDRRAANLFSGMRKIFVNISSENTLVLAVDDLNFAGQLTLQFFSILQGLSDIKKLLFIGTYNKESLENLKDFSSAKDASGTLKLKPFIKDEISLLIASIFPGIKIESKTAENIFKTSKGCPLSLCELLKSLVEKDKIRYESGQWKLIDIDAKDVPESIEGVIQPKFIQLDDETKKMLSAIAVMGGKIEMKMLEKFSGYNEGRLLELLDRAITAGLIRLPGVGDGSVSFRTESSREALADTIPQQEADLIHQKLDKLTKENRQAGLLDQDELSLSSELKDILDKTEKRKEAPVSIEEIIERPLSEASTKIVKDAILALRAGVIGTLLYPEGNSMRVDMENRGYEIIRKILKNDPTLTFSNVEDKILVNGYAPKSVDVKGTAGFTFSGLMEDYGVSSITFKRDMKKEEFSSFLYCLGRSEEEIKQGGGLAELLKKRNVFNIKIDQVRYEKLSTITKKVMSIQGGKGEKRSMSQLSKDKLLDLPIERYADPGISGNLGLIVEALLLGKNNEKVKSIIGKISGDLGSTKNADKLALTEGAIRLSEPLIAYDKSNLSGELIKALVNRFDKTNELEEFTKLCSGLKTIAVGLMDKGNFSQAEMIIEHFKGQVATDSSRSKEQKIVAQEELGKIANPRVIEALVNAFRESLKVGKGVDVSGILAGIGEHALGSVLNILTQEEVSDKDPLDLYIMRQSVAMVLKKMGQPAKDALKNMLTDSREHVTRNVIEVLGYIGGEDVITLLAPFLHAASRQVRMQCVIALKRIGTKESSEILIEAFKDRSNDVKEAASLAIAKLADTSFIEKLKPLLANKATEEIIKKTIQRIEMKAKRKR